MNLRGRRKRGRLVIKSFFLGRPSWSAIRSSWLYKSFLKPFTQNVCGIFQRSHFTEHILKVAILKNLEDSERIFLVLLSKVTGFQPVVSSKTTFITGFSLETFSIFLQTVKLLNVLSYSMALVLCYCTKSHIFKQVAIVSEKTSAESFYISYIYSSKKICETK